MLRRVLVNDETVVAIGDSNEQLISAGRMPGQDREGNTPQDVTNYL